MQSKYLSDITGFVLSICLTIAAYVLVIGHLITGNRLIGAIVGLAIVQLLVQLFFFLHLGQETRPRWKLVVFLFMLLVLFILVFGSLWIMYNLDYHMDMAPGQLDEYIIDDEGYSR